MLAKHQGQEGWKELMILDGGQADVGLESTVVDGVTASDEIRILRLGGIGPDVIAECLREAGMEDVRVKVYGKDWTDEKVEAKPATPGMKYRHYAPSCPVLCVQSDSSSSQSISEAISSKLEDIAAIGLLCLDNSSLPQLLKSHKLSSYSFGPVDSPSTHAARLFDGLRSLEQQGVKLILVERPEKDAIWENGIGAAVWERVGKSGGGLKSSVKFKPS